MAREILKEALGPGPGCLPLALLGRYADGTLAADDHRAAAAHVRACINCQSELALLQAFTSGPLSPEELAIAREGLAPRERSRPALAGVRLPSFWFRLAAAVAAVLLIVVAGRVSLRGPNAPELPASVSTADDVPRSQAISVRGPVGDQRETPRRFDWIAVDRAGRYRVRLMEVDRREVWSVMTTDAGVELPSTVRALSVPSKTLLWDVTAYDASGAVIADSGPQAFRLVLR
jgi:hypothetical protein